MAGGTVLINSQGTAEELAPDQVQGALQSGYQVPLIDQQGNPFAVSYEEAHNLIQQGTHAQPSDVQLHGLLEDAHYGSGGQQALAFVEGALNPATLGLYGKIAEGTGLTTSEDMLKRREHNPGTAALGELTGTVGSLALLPEASIPGLISKAGNAAKAAYAAEGIVGKGVMTAVQGAVEGALYGAQHEATEAVLGNPAATGENLLSNIGLSAALGGGLNLALSPVLKAAEEGARLIDKRLSPVIEGLAKKKPNAGEVEAASERLGAPLLESQILDSKTAQHLESSLLKAGEAGRSLTGVARQQQLAEGFSIIRQKIDDILGADVGMTKAQVGDALKTGLQDSLEAETKPITELYNKVKAMGQDIPLNPADLEKMSGDILSIDGLLTSTGKPISKSAPEYRFAKRAADEIQQLGTVDDLRRFMEQKSREAMGNPELKYVIGQVRNKITELSENSIKNFAEATMPDALGLIEQHALAKKSYAILRDKIDDLGSVIGKKLRKGEGPTAFIEWLENTPPEQVANRLFTKDNSKFLSFLQENYPEQAALLANLKRSQFRTAPGAMIDGQIQPKKLLNEINKLEPEIKDFLFNKDQIQTIKDAQTWIESLPKDANPSGTAAMNVSLREILNPMKILGVAGEQVADHLKLKTLQKLASQDPANAPLIMALGHLSNMIVKTNRQLQKFSGAIFSSPAASIMKEDKRSQNTDSGTSLNKIGTLVLNNVTNPEGLINHLSSSTEGMSQYAPESANAFTASVGRAVNFLSTKIPTPQKNAPLDPELPPSKMEIQKFNRYAQIVDKPMTVLQHVKDGTLLSQDIETMQAVYPALYENMKQVVLDKMINTVSKKPAFEIPYKTRLGLSMFLGQNLDSSLSSQSIQSSQLALTSAAIEQAQKQQMQSARPSKAGMGKMDTTQDMTKAQQSASRSNS